MVVMSFAAAVSAAAMAAYAAGGDSYVYDAPADEVRDAARFRVEAMDHSDAWVARGCGLDDPLLTRERRALIASHTALRRAVGRD